MSDTPPPPEPSGSAEQPYGPPPYPPADDQEPTRRFEVPPSPTMPPSPPPPAAQASTPPPPPGQYPQWGQYPQYPQYPQYGQYPQGPQYAQPYGPGFGAFGPVTNQKAAWALGVGIASIVLGCCFALFGLGGIASIVLGVQARREIAASGGMQTGEGLAISGIVTGVVALLWGVGMGLYLVLSRGTLVATGG